MTKLATEKRIEMIQLIHKLKCGDEKPGETILRALREAVKRQTLPVGGPAVPMGASVLVPVAHPPKIA